MEVSWRPITCSHKEGTSGYIVAFGECEGVVSTCEECDGPTWEVISEEPLTLEPSIACPLHAEHHGWIRNGEWVNA